VLLANGEDARAIIGLLDALELFNNSGDTGNAANAAVELAALTQEARFVEIARAQSIRQPQSILAQKVARLEDKILTGALA
jgi:hypothetical protein